MIMYFNISNKNKFLLSYCGEGDGLTSNLLWLLSHCY